VAEFERLREFPPHPPMSVLSYTMDMGPPPSSILSNTTENNIDDGFELVSLDDEE